MTDKAIEFKNNQKSAVFAIGDIQRIKLMRDQDKILHKMEVTTKAGSEIIDLDEMELDAFLVAIDQYASEHYRILLG